jgi:hypothetical protein
MDLHDRGNAALLAPYFTNWYIMDLYTTIMHQFVKFCNLCFRQLNVVGSGQKFVWILQEITQHN